MVDFRFKSHNGSSHAENEKEQTCDQPARCTLRKSERQWPAAIFIQWHPNTAGFAIPRMERRTNFKQQRGRVSGRRVGHRPSLRRRCRTLRFSGCGCDGDRCDGLGKFSRAGYWISFGGGTITSPNPISICMWILARSKRATRLTRRPS